MILSLEESLSLEVRDKFKTYLTNTIIGKEWRCSKFLCIRIITNKLQIYQTQVEYAHTHPTRTDPYSGEGG